MVIVVAAALSMGSSVVIQTHKPFLLFLASFPPRFIHRVSNTDVLTSIHVHAAELPTVSRAPFNRLTGRHVGMK